MSGGYAHTRLAAVLDLLARRGLDEFAFVQAMAVALGLRPLHVSEALEELVAVGYVDRHALIAHPLAYSVTPAGLRAASAARGA